MGFQFLALRYCVFLFFVAVLVPAQSGDDNSPDWIPAGTVSQPVIRRAIETKARLQSRDPAVQKRALRQVLTDINEFGRTEMRTAAVPLVLDLLDQDYQILEFPQDYRIEYSTRLLALEVLADLGGDDARRSIRTSIERDDDGTIRAGAAQLLARYPGNDPTADLHAVAAGLLRAVRRNGNENEIARLLDAARVLSRRTWTNESPDLIRSLVSIYTGPYSAGLRSTAMSFLEELADR